MPGRFFLMSTNTSTELRRGETFYLRIRYPSREIAENMVRKEFSKTEAAAIEQAVEPEVRASRCSRRESTWSLSMRSGHGRLKGLAQNCNLTLWKHYHKVSRKPATTTPTAHAHPKLFQPPSYGPEPQPLPTQPQAVGIESVRYADWPSRPFTHSVLCHS